MNKEIHKKSYPTHHSHFSATIKRTFAVSRKHEDPLFNNVHGIMNGEAFEEKKCEMIWIV